MQTRIFFYAEGFQTEDDRVRTQKFCWCWFVNPLFEMVKNISENISEIHVLPAEYYIVSDALAIKIGDKMETMQLLLVSPLYATHGESRRS